MRNHLILIPMALLLLAILPLPYGFYTLLRLVVMVSAGLLAWQAYQEKQTANAQVVVFGLLALLFNPLIPVHLDREIWFFLDIGAAGIFAAQWYRSATQS